MGKKEEKTKKSRSAKVSVKANVKERRSRSGSRSKGARRELASLNAEEVQRQLDVALKHERKSARAQAKRDAAASSSTLKQQTNAPTGRQTDGKQGKKEGSSTKKTDKEGKNQSKDKGNKKASERTSDSTDPPNVKGAPMTDGDKKPPARQTRVRSKTPPKTARSGSRGRSKDRAATTMTAGRRSKTPTRTQERNQALRDESPRRHESAIPGMSEDEYDDEDDEADALIQKAHQQMERNRRNQTTTRAHNNSTKTNGEHQIIKPALRPAKYSSTNEKTDENTRTLPITDITAESGGGLVIENGSIDSFMISERAFGVNVTPFTSYEDGKWDKDLADFFINFCAVVKKLDTKQQKQSPAAPSDFSQVWKAGLETIENADFLAQRLAISDPRKLWPNLRTAKGMIRANQVAFWIASCMSFVNRFDPRTGQVRIAETSKRPLIEARYQFVFEVLAGNTKRVAERLADALKNIHREVDKTFRVLPWSSTSKQPAWKAGTKLPESGDLLQLYAPGATATTLTRTVWVKIRGQMQGDPTQITTGFDKIMSDYGPCHGLKIYKNTLTKAENPKQIGWLAYTGNFTNPEKLTALLQKSLHEYREKFEIGLKVKPIREIPSGEAARDKHYDEGGSWENMHWQAAHVEVDRKDVKKAMDALYYILNRTESERPAGMFIWFVPFAKFARFGLRGAELLRKSRNTHSRILKNLVACKSEDIVDLDKEIEGITLRELIMQKRSEKTGKGLFHSVDVSTSFQDAPGTIVATAVKGHADEAETYMNALPCICRTMNEAYKEWFVPGGAVDSEEFQVDERTLAYTSRSDAVMECMEEESRMHFVLLEEQLADQVETPSEMDNASFGSAIRNNDQYDNWSASDRSRASSTNSNQSSSIYENLRQQDEASRGTRTTNTGNRTERSRLKDARIAELEAQLAAQRVGSTQQQFHDTGMPAADDEIPGWETMDDDEPPPPLSPGKGRKLESAVPEESPKRPRQMEPSADEMGEAEAYDEQQVEIEQFGARDTDPIQLTSSSSSSVQSLVSLASTDRESEDADSEDEQEGESDAEEVYDEDSAQSQPEEENTEDEEQSRQSDHQEETEQATPDRDARDHRQQITPDPAHISEPPEVKRERGVDLESYMSQTVVTQDQTTRNHMQAFQSLDPASYKGLIENHAARQQTKPTEATAQPQQPQGGGEA